MRTRFLFRREGQDWALRYPLDIQRPSHGSRDPFPPAQTLPHTGFARGTGQADVLSYLARISYLGRLGPASNVVQATRLPTVPVVPPPFQVQVLGIDFYSRTAVEIRLTQPQAGKFTVWWADGELDAAAFNDKAVAGLYAAQSAYQNQYLYDLLALPIPTQVKRTVTFGLQAVNDAGGESPFVVLPLELEALV
jgi:hypothetical protein